MEATGACSGAAAAAATVSVVTDPWDAAAADQRLISRGADAVAIVDRASAAGVMPPALAAPGARRRLVMCLQGLLGALMAPEGLACTLATVRAAAVLIQQRVPVTAANAATQQLEELRERLRMGSPVELARLLLLTNLVALLAEDAEQGRRRGGGAQIKHQQPAAG
jgi:hypothetical protein